MREFSSIQEIEEYIKSIPYKYFNEDTFVTHVYPIFASPLINDHETFSSIQSCFYIATSTFLPHIVLRHVSEINDMDISFFKFCILCGLRGPYTEKEFKKQLTKNKTSTIFLELAKHKDFPVQMKKLFFEWTGEICYLPKEAQDMFVF